MKSMFDDAYDAAKKVVGDSIDNKRVAMDAAHELKMKPFADKLSASKDIMSRTDIGIKEKLALLDGLEKGASDQMEKKAFLAAAARVGAGLLTKAKPFLGKAMNAVKDHPLAFGSAIGAGGLGYGMGAKSMNKTAAIKNRLEELSEIILSPEAYEVMKNRVPTTKVASIMGAARQYAGDLGRAVSLVGENPHAIKNTAGLMRINAGQKAAEAVKRSIEMKQVASIMGKGKLTDQALAEASRNQRIGARRANVKSWMDQQDDARLYSIAKKMGS